MKENSLIKVLFTIPNFDTAGSGKALLNIASRLDNNLFEPHIACMHDKGDYFNIVEKSGIPVHILQFTTPMIGRIKGILNCWKISKLMKKINPHIIHSFHYAADYSEVIAARMAGIPWIYTKKNMNWGGNSKNGWKLRSFLAAHILAQNTDMIRFFFPHWKNVSLVPRGVNTDKFFFEEKDTELINKYNIAANEKVILTVANLVPVKGIEILLDALQLFSRNDCSFRLFIVGDKNNNYGKEMEKKASMNTLSSKIHFVGKVQDVKKYYSITDIFVLPTLDLGRREGSPVSLLEAMSCNLPVIASDISGVNDILEPFPDTNFKAGDISALNKLLKKMLCNYNLHSGMELNYRSYIKNNFDISLEVSRHENIYKNLLK
ncbi:MAG: glycosyltransferase [Pelagibacterales bacterium]|nr:glycosyltransferase [Pelagibacterales bacterium]